MINKQNRSLWTRYWTSDLSFTKQKWLLLDSDDVYQDCTEKVLELLHKSSKYNFMKVNFSGTDF